MFYVYLIFFSSVCGFSSLFCLCAFMYVLEYVLVGFVLSGFNDWVLVGIMFLRLVSNGLLVFLFLFFPLCIVLSEWFVVVGMLLWCSL